MTQHPRQFAVVFTWAVVGVATGLSAQTRVSDTVHNLSVGGSGSVRAAAESQICVFCHAPHNTRGAQPLWNRELPATSYTIYQSSTLDAETGQPTGSSKLCLSCHDGTIALGSVLSRADRIRMVGGDYIPAGLTNLGTDLSDDHPVSFPYTSGLAASDGQLKSPVAVRGEIKLSTDQQLQCTSCHDAHNNMHGDFLVMSNEFGALCRACHQMDGWPISAHRDANRVMPPSSMVDWPYNTVAENACRSCHRPHTAGGRERLLIFDEEESICLECHSGQAGGVDIRAEMDKVSAHDTRRYNGAHDPREQGPGNVEHVECSDCHNPHAVSAQSRVNGYIPIGATLANVRGVSIGGGQLDEARNEYEICLRCHGDAAVRVRRRILRQAETTNLRLKFSSGNASFHPVALSSPSRDTVSLAPGLAAGDMIRCTDCHNSDSAQGGSGPPRGPHGSIYSFLLERNYTVIDQTAESEFEYAMCYKCHQRSSILGDQSFPQHRLHIVEQNTPCSACHDPHGISRAVSSGGSDHTHLINFDAIIVRPAPATGRLEFRDLGTYAGSCTLVCHGVEHIDLQYAR